MSPPGDFQRAARSDPGLGRPAFLRRSDGNVGRHERRRTRIVATIGPASEDADTLKQMADAGMDVARVSLSHGPIEKAVERIRRIRSVAPKVAILADLPGPKIRSTPFPGDGVELVTGEQVALVPGREAPQSTAQRIGVALDEAVSDLVAGDRVSIGDGGVTLVVSGRRGSDVICTVVGGGHVQGQPGVSVPGHRLALETPTKEDLERIRVLVAEGVDHIAVSFVRGPDDMNRARAELAGSPTMLVSKIETPDAIEHLDEVLRASDAVMVARGDLGMRVPLEDVPHLQKDIIRTGVRLGLPVITATQMLESMIDAAIPTRAEVTDVANAVLDGTSAVMLSGETAIGRDPVLVIETMARIVVRTEADFNYVGWGAHLDPQEIAGEPNSPAHVTAAITGAAWRAALELDAAAIIACTRSGATARAISRFRPLMPILAATTTERVYRQLALSWGVEALLVGEAVTTDDVIKQAVDAAVASGAIKSSDLVVVLAGSPHASVSVSDTLQLVRVP
ncbi:MAG TPA: pyruvate kinase [Acidimicrobiales bacterium]|nr:pyruvate kinase [Acidimicrobiales bacterium]